MRKKLLLFLYVLLLILMSGYALSLNECLGDLNQDYRVNAQDIAGLSSCYNSNIIIDLNCSRADLNKDGKVDSLDIAGFSSNYGKICSNCSNHIQDYEETDIDCGGSICKKCSVYKRCRASSDCNSSVCASGQCADLSNCMEVIPGLNNASANRVNLIFVPVNYPDTIYFRGQALDYIDYYNNSYRPGLLAFAPFIDNKNKFNFWFVNSSLNVSYNYLNCTASTCNCYDNYSNIVSKDYNFCKGLPNYQYANIYNFQCRAGVAPAKYMHICGATGSPSLVHEFGHSFASLMDEYVPAAWAWGYPNCAPDMIRAQQWWGDLIGIDGVGYFQGCGNSNSNIKPTECSIMKTTWNSSCYTFGLVNERYISSLLQNYSQ
jgi:hypothetical protein